MHLSYPLKSMIIDFVLLKSSMETERRNIYHIEKVDVFWIKVKKCFVIHTQKHDSFP